VDNKKNKRRQNRLREAYYMQGIYTQIFEAAEPERLTAVLIHGAADHSARYRHVIEKLNGRGISVVTGDLPGHGRSAGLPGHIDRFDDYLDTVEGWVRQAEQLAGKNGRIALIGHSMGGLVVVRFLQERGEQHPKIAKAVLSSPCLKVAVEVPAWKRALAKLLDRVMPKLRLPSNISSSYLTRNKGVVAAYEQDPLCGGAVSVRWYQELMRAGGKARAEAGKIKVPVLLMQAGEDRLVDPREAEPFFRQLSAQEESRYIHYPQCYHELFHEPEQEEILEEMLVWMVKP
jgi:lysophospholipase